MKISVLKMFTLISASFLYLFLGTAGIALTTPLHSSVMLLIFVSTVLVIPVVLIWRDIYKARRFTVYESSYQN
jgi:hypothetical protein